MSIENECSPRPYSLKIEIEKRFLTLNKPNPDYVDRIRDRKELNERYGGYTIKFRLSYLMTVLGRVSLTRYGRICGVRRRRGGCHCSSSTET